MVRICPRAPGRTTIELLFRCPCSSDVGLVHARAPATLRPTFAVKDDILSVVFVRREGWRPARRNTSRGGDGGQGRDRKTSLRTELQDACLDIGKGLISGRVFGVRTTASFDEVVCRDCPASTHLRFFGSTVMPASGRRCASGGWPIFSGSRRARGNQRVHGNTWGLADGAGFEPAKLARAFRFSRPVPSATRPPVGRYDGEPYNGEPGRIRTFDLSIKSRLLYQLSYGARAGGTWRHVCEQGPDPRKTVGMLS